MYGNYNSNNHVTGSLRLWENLENLENLEKIGKSGQLGNTWKTQGSLKFFAETQGKLREFCKLLWLHIEIV